MNAAAWIIAIACVPAFMLWTATNLRSAAHAVPTQGDHPVLTGHPTTSIQLRSWGRRWSQAGFASIQLDDVQRTRPPAPPLPSTPHVLVVPVQVPGKEDPVHDVACSWCGVLSTRTLAVAAEEEASWHRLRALHRNQPAAPGRTLTLETR